MKYFVEHRGEVVTRDELLDAVWGYDGLPLTRTVDMHIAKLRQKIEDTPGDPRFIVTVHRVGYKLDRKSTRLNSSHANISYAVFCLKKKNFILSLYFLSCGPTFDIVKIVQRPMLTSSQLTARMPSST